MGVLDGRTAVVTGAATGLGRAFAGALAAAGARVAIADVQGVEAKEAADDLAQAGADAIGIAFDQADPASVDAMVRETEASLGPIDVLVNNASLFSTLQRKRALEILPDEWIRVVQVNLNGVFFCCRAAMPGMVDRGYGKVVNISSASIFSAKNGLAHYVAAKAAVVGMTRALAREYGDSGITVNAISPGATDSGSILSTPEYLQSKVSARSIQRVQTPDDLIGAVVFFCSPASDFITGQNLVVDGGAEFQ
jgi:3-oxoacyl-[acyl-carrier protein] reductase